MTTKRTRIKFLDPGDIEEAIVEIADAVNEVRRIVLAIRGLRRVRNTEQKHDGVVGKARRVRR